MVDVGRREDACGHGRPAVDRSSDADEALEPASADRRGARALHRSSALAGSLAAIAGRLGLDPMGERPVGRRIAAGIVVAPDGRRAAAAARLTSRPRSCASARAVERADRARHRGRDRRDRTGRVSLVKDPKETLVEYLQSARDAMVWKVEGLSEYDARRPMTPTGTNLLGLVKHLASVELGYFGDTFGRPSGIALPWHADDADLNDDLYLTADETPGVGAGPLPHRLGARRGDVRGVRPRHRGPGAVVGRPRRGDPAPDPGPHDDRDPPARRPRRHRARDHRRPGRPEARATPTCEDGYDWPAYVAKVEAARPAAGA